jgi:hypothetical protein
MSQLKLRITLNKGKRGIPLSKLELLVEEMRKFLTSMGEDFELVEPTNWAGVDFRNSSLEFTSEYQLPVGMDKLVRFNGAVRTLTRSEFPSSLQSSTSEHFFKIANMLDSDEVADIAVFEENGTPVQFEISRRTASLAWFIDVLPYRETNGAIQGQIHSLYKESKPPHFMLRELSTGNLIKCEYEVTEYPAIVQALKNKDQVLHVSGTIITKTRERNIDHIKVKQILLAESYGFEEVERFLRSEKSQ